MISNEIMEVIDLDCESVNKIRIGNLTYCTIDCIQSSPIKSQLFSYYTYLDTCVRDFIKLRQKFLLTLSERDHYIYSNVCKLVTFYYNEFNQVMDLRMLNDLLDIIHQTPYKTLLTEYDAKIAKCQILWKKGPLLKPEKIIKKKRDVYTNILLKILNPANPIRSSDLAKIHETINNATATSNHEIFSERDLIALRYIFGPKLWLHQHYLDHILNIYYLLKLQFNNEFTYEFASGRYFCFLAKNGVICHGMFVNRSSQHHGHQEHVMIHHNIYAKMFQEVYVENGSLLLHSYASQIFPDTHCINIFPLAIMYAILKKFKQTGKIKFDTHDSPIFDDIPMEYFYQPLITITITTDFANHHKSIIQE